MVATFDLKDDNDKYDEPDEAHLQHGTPLRMVTYEDDDTTDRQVTLEQQ